MSLTSMTPKERLLASMQGKPVDHVAFSPFLAYYFDFLPQNVRDKGQLDYLINMGATPLIRGGIKNAFEIKNKTFEKKTVIDKNKRYETVETPYGTLKWEFTYVASGNTWFLTSHPVSDLKFLPALIAYYKDIEVVEKIKEVNAAIKELGDAGLSVSGVGTNYKSAYQFLLENLIGTQELIYFTMDEPDLLDEVLDIMQKKNMQTIIYTAESDIEACISYEDSSTTNVNPSIYEKYIASEIARWCKTLNDSDTLYIQHACGHIKHLLTPMANQGVTMIESISPPPTGNVTIAEAVSILPESVGLIGGIEPVQFLNDSIDSILEYCDELIAINKGRRFILANSDSCPPHVEYEKFRAISEFVKTRTL